MKKNSKADFAAAGDEVTDGSRLIARVSRAIAHLGFHPSVAMNAIQNSGWLVFGQLVRLGVGLVVGVWLARYLGPRLFGALSFAGAFVAMFGTFATLGLSGVVVREFVQKPSLRDQIFSVAVILRLAGGVLAFLGIWFLIRVIRPSDPLINAIVVILGIATLFRFADTIKDWFEACVQSRYVVWVESLTGLGFALVKVVLIIQKAPLIAFVWVIAGELFLIAVLLVGLYRSKGGRLYFGAFDGATAKAMLRVSWPLMLSGMAIALYMRVDQVMLGVMMGNDAVGHYAVAVRISEIAFFVPTAVVVSVFPSLARARETSPLKYQKRLQQLYDLMVWSAVLIALPVFLLSDWIVIRLFGLEFSEGGDALAIHIWSAVFVFLGVASSKWLILEGLQIHAFFRTAVGLAINVLANLALITRYGIKGAAAATLLSQLVAAYGYDVIAARTRSNFLLKTAALFPFLRLFRHTQRNQ